MKLKIDEIYTHMRKIIIEKENYSSTYMPSSIFHREFDNHDGADYKYNILYYYKLENCRNDCGTEIIFINKFGEPVQTKLPIIKGLIICMKDNLLYHKSPIIQFIDPERISERIIIRSWANESREQSDDQLDQYANSLNQKLANECTEKIQSNMISDEERIYCHHLLEILKSR